MRARPLVILAFAATSLLALAASVVHAGGIGVSTVPEPITTENFEKLFYARRPNPNQTRLSNRDIEFMWSDSFRVAVGGTDGLSSTIRARLDRLGENIAENSSNPLGIPVADLRLVYDYFRQTGAGYDANPLDPIGFLTGGATCNANSFPNGWNVPDLDRSHVDDYVYVPHEMGNTGGSASSAFQTYKEDSTTGHLANVISNPTPSQRDTMFCTHTNSIMVPGPVPASSGDTAWTSSDDLADWGFCHEFQHTLPAPPGQAQWRLAIQEIFSSAAEALVGEKAATPVYDVAYTWPLLGDDFSGGTCTKNFWFGQNYQNWRLFGAYMVYNFRGQDTTHVIGAIEDDLMHRWARNSHLLSGLRGLLKNDSCWNCAQVNYFKKGGVALDDTSRLCCDPYFVRHISA